MIRLALADDHALVRAGIVSLLRSIDGIQVVAEANDGRELLDLLPKHRPDVVLMDIAMPGLNGLDAVSLVLRDSPMARVIMLSMHNSPEYVARAMTAGASGYVVKGAGLTELETAIRTVASGGIYLGVKIPNRRLGDYLRNTGKTQDRLTPRQREILQLVAEGHTTQSIANKLCLSVKTVETHRAQLMQRLDIHDLAGLIRYAIRTGIIISED